MSYIRFYNNYVFDMESTADDAVFIDTRYKRRLTLNGVKKEDIAELKYKTFEELEELELTETAIAVLKSGIAYLSDLDQSSLALGCDELCIAFENKLFSWWKSTMENATPANAPARIRLTA